MKRLGLVLMIVAVTVVPHRAATTGRGVLDVAGRASATVSLASGAGLLAAAWSASLPGGETDIYLATSRDGGASFSAPVRVNSVPGDARVNGEQPPRVTVAARAGAAPVMTVVWTSKNEQGTTILSARSEDGGRTFGRSALVPGGAAAGNRGWENIALDSQGRTRVVWLDHREMVSPKPAGADGHNSPGEGGHPGHDSAAAADGYAMAQKSKLYLATVGDAASVRTLAAGVCYCCKTAIVTGAGNSLFLAWRHVYPGNLRDIAFTVSHDGGRTFAPPQRVSEDRWQLDGCPDDGPAMSADASGRLHIAWPTLVSDTANGRPSIGIFYAQSRDGGAFGPRERLATEGLPHHPQVVTNGNRVFVAWDELQQGRRRIVLAHRDARTATGFTRTVVAEGTGLLYPSMAASGTGVMLAWTAGGERSTIQLARVE